MGILAKFSGEQDPERHQGKLFWPGDAGGFPVRSQDTNVELPLLKDSEVDELKRVGDFHCEMFDLAVEEQRAEYQEIMNRSVNGWFKVLEKIPFKDEQKRTLSWYLEWVQIYAQMPKGA